MLILKILLILITVIILFVIFLRHNFEFLFETHKFWKISYSNIFMKYSIGTNGRDFDFFIKFKPKPYNPVFSEEKKQTEILTSAKPVEIREKSREDRLESPAKPQKNKKNKREKNENINDIGEFTIENEKSGKTFQDYIEIVKNIWMREEKFIKSILQYALRAIKISLKLLIPAKINLSIEGGNEDPAETGWYYSVFIFINEYFEKNKRINVNFMPQFQNPEWHAKGQIIYSFSIAGLLLFVFLILITFPYLQTIKCFWRNRKYLKRNK